MLPQGVSAAALAQHATIALTVLTRRPNMQCLLRCLPSLRFAVALVALLFSNTVSFPSPFMLELNSSRQRLLALAQQGRAALTNHEPDRALAAYQEALHLAQRQNDYLAAAAVHNLLGEVHEGAGRYQDALGQYEAAAQALSRERTSRDTVAVDETLARLRAGEKGFAGNTGLPVSTDLQRGELGELAALLRLPQARAKAELMVLSIINIGNMYLQQSQYELAEARYFEALRLARQHRLPERPQQLLTNLAWSAIKSGRLELADSRLDSVLAAVDSPAPLTLRRAMLALAVNLREQQQFGAAFAQFEQTLPLYRAAQDERGYCRGLTALAATHALAGEFEKARDHYRAALAANLSVQDQETEWQAHGGLAICLHHLAELEPALQHYDRYLTIVEQIGGNFATDQGKTSFLENQDKMFEDYARAACQLAQQRGDWGLARAAIERVRGRALPSLQRARLRLPPRPAGRLPAAYVLRSGEPAAWPNQSMMVQMAVGVDSPPALGETGDLPLEELPRELQKMAAGVPVRAQESDSAAADSAARPALTFLEYYVMAEQTVILVRRANGEIHGAIAPIHADSLAALVQEYAQALAVQAARGLSFERQVLPTASAQNPPPPRDERTIAQRLHRLLIAPVREFLPAETHAAMVVVPHRALWSLPFAALRDEHGRYFSDQHVLSYAASLASWQILAGQPRPADQHNVRAWVVGNPRLPAAAEACGFVLRMQPLPGAQQEAEAIAKLLGSKRSRLFTGSQADRLRLEAWHADYTLFHFATHGFACAEDPLSSFIVLSQLEAGEMAFDPANARLALRDDGRLAVTLENLPATEARHAELISSYPGLLSARTIINPARFNFKADLVTLSACQTGLGKLLSEGMIGLSRAFLAAGARSLLVSLWRVDDEATKELMIAFYREYLRHGNKGRALQQAMQHTRQRHPEPRFWAAFTLLGMVE